MVERGFSDIWTTSADGLRLHVRSYGDPRAVSTPVICLPGLARHAVDFHELAQALTAPGEPPRHVLAVDYRGRGLSDHDPDPTHYTVPVEIEDLLTLLRQLGIQRATFVGTSRGGIITMALAASRPELVLGAVLNDIGPVLEREGLLRIKSYIGKLGDPADYTQAAGVLRMRFGAQFPNLTEQEWDGWARNTWEERGGRLVLTYDAALARTLDAIGPDTPVPDMWPLFDALRDVPVLAIRGALSDLLSEGTAAEMAARHPGLELLTIPDQGHAPLLKSPDLIRAICDFVQRTQTAQPRADGASESDLPRP